jgi:hypothetical protein
LISDRSGEFFLVGPSVLGTNDLSQGEFAVYPNPASERLQIESANETISSIQIVNMLGQVLFSENDSNVTSKSIDIASFSEGMYFVTINNHTTKKIIKK